MFSYYARLWLQYQRDIISLAILADTRPNWRPQQYERSLAGCRVLFEFPVVKVLDFDEAELEASENPCALWLLAFRKAQETEGRAALRLEARKVLVRLMVDRGYDIDTQAELLRLLEWVMSLPETFEALYEEFLETVKREQGTPFLSVLERRGIRQGLEQGLEEGLREGLLNLLQDLYGEVPEELKERIRKISGRERLRALYSEAVRAGSLEVFQQRLGEV